LTNNIQDPPWYTTALEGCATSFVIVADAGGHRNFTYVEVAVIPVVGRGCHRPRIIGQNKRNSRSKFGWSQSLHNLILLCHLHNAVTDKQAAAQEGEDNMLTSQTIV